MPNTLLHKRGTSKPSPSDLLVGEIAINTSEGKLFTENDSGYIWEAGELLGTFSGTTITYTVTVASKTSSHRYNGQGSSLGYKINGVFSPFLTLTPGNTYRFDQSDSSNSNHPLKFYLEANKSTLYSTDVTINGTAGQSGAYTEITISDTTPLVLHYQCGFHGYMGNAVFCNSKTVNYNDLENKPSLFSGNYNDLSNKPSLFSGDYDDLSNKPSLFSGSYNDLSNKPTIPTLTSQLTNDSGFITTGGGGLTDGDKGDIVVSNGGDTLTIDSNVITQSKIADDAVGTDQIATLSIINNRLADGSITNSKVNASAAIAGTKISPIFGTGGDLQNHIGNRQRLAILGSSSSGSMLHIRGGSPAIFFDQSGGNISKIYQDNVNLAFHAGTPASEGTNTFLLKADGDAVFSGNLDVGAGLDVTGNITATGTIDAVLKNGVTATTQSAGDNSTKVATTAYTDTAIANLADSAPSTLNTLNELAAALGDDANFSTTVTNSIATKLPLAGGTLTGLLTVTRSSNSGSDPILKVLHSNLSQGIGLGYHAISAIGANTNVDLKLQSKGSGEIILLDNVNAEAGIDVTGNITVTGTVDGRDLAADGNKLDGIAAGATNVTNNNQIANGAGYITSASLVGVSDGGNAASLDGIDSSQFLRSDQNDTSSGTVAFGRGVLDPDSFGSFSGGFGNIQDGSGWGASGVFVHGGGTGDAAAMAHNGNALFFGIQNNASANSMETWLQVTPASRVINFSTDNNATNVQIGGNKIFHAGNDGAGSNLDADLLDGQQGSYYLDYNNFSNKPTIPTNNNQLTNGAGYITAAALAGASDGGNAALLDGIDSTQFLRSDQSDTMGGLLTLSHSGDQKILLQGSNNPYIRFREGTTDKAFIQFSSSGYFRLKNEEDNSELRLQDDFKFSNDGTNFNKIFHAGNDGSGSGLDADTLDGIQASSFLRSDATDTCSGQITHTNKVIIDHNSGNMLELKPTNGGPWVISINRDDLSQSRVFVHNTNGVGWVFEHKPKWYNSGNYNNFLTTADEGSGGGIDADTVDGFESVKLYRQIASASATVGSGWMTVAENTNHRQHGEIIVSDSESSDHSFIRIDWMRSYADSCFTVINCGGHSNRITGVRVLRDNDTTYGNKKLQVYVTTNSNYKVQVNQLQNQSGWIGHTVVTPVIQDTISGYVTQGQVMESLDTYNFSAEDGIQAGAGGIKSNGSIILGSHSHKFQNGNVSNNLELRTGNGGSSSSGISVKNGAGNWRFQLYGDGSSYGFLNGNWGGWDIKKTTNGNFQVNEGNGLQRVWNAGNDGSGSGLDADTLDGNEASAFPTLSGSNSFSNSYNEFGNSTGSVSNNGNWNARLNLAGSQHARLDVQSVSDGIITTMYAHTGHSTGRVGTTSNHGLTLMCNGNSRAELTTGGTLTTHQQGTIWGSSNDGSGSGLDADNLDGRTWSESASNSTIVSRTNSGYIYANYFNTTANDTGSGIDCKFYASEDNFIRYIDLSSMRSVMNTSARSSAFAGREHHSTDMNYWIGSAGWGADNFDTTVWDYGSCFFDVWSNPSGQPSGTSHWTGVQAMHYTNGSARYGMRITCGAGNTSLAYIQGRWNTTTYGWHKLWNENNDGSGSGLDADLLDGIQASSFIRSDTSDTMNGELQMSVNQDRQIILNRNISSPSNYYNGLQMEVRATSGTAGIGLHRNGYSHVGIYTNATNVLKFDMNAGAVTLNHNTGTIWGSGNDGSGSGLDADLWDGNQFSSYLNQAVLTTSNPTFNKVYANDWFRVNGADGIYWESYGGGWYMTDTTWVRVYNSKRLYVQNEIAATGNITAYYSDERLKEKLGDIDNALDKVNQIETFYYKENDLAKKFGFNKPDKQVGVSAQSVEKVLPEVVSLAPFDFETAEDGTISSKSGENYKTVDYEKLVPLLIESIKELTNKVKVLENKLNVE